MMVSNAEILAARILIVDDQPANVHLLQRLLAEAGYSTVSATMDPREVSSLQQAQAFDLILLDLQMPGMDGFEVLAALQAALPTDAHGGYVPVMVITAQPDLKLRALQAGAKDFISKPFDLLELKTRIRNQLEVRLLYQRLEQHNLQLEATVAERTAELRESEARYRRLTELASDWHWEQDPDGRFTRMSGPVLEILGLRVGGDTDLLIGEPAGWNEAERTALREAINAHRPFLDLPLSRKLPDGYQQHYRVSGEPIFDRSCRFIGYRGVGVEVLT
ncbi:response regulator [Ideonella sp.]|uniref:response regulator n=1 Tax=Ideonella sp. TaxID=1929293 RepID=UPI003BB68785